MSLKTVWKRSTENDRQKRAYYAKLMHRMDSADRTEWHRGTRFGLGFVFVGMPFALLAWTGIGFMVLGAEGATLGVLSGLIIMQLHLFQIGYFNRKQMREYHERRTGREPRPWVKKERDVLGVICTGELAAVPHATVALRLRKE